MLGALTYGNRGWVYDTSTHVLERVCQYLYYNAKWSTSQTPNSKDGVPNFDIEPEMLLELLMAANFLEC